MPHLPRLLSRWALVALVAAAAAQARAGAFRNSAHGNEALLPIACGSCHVGHGSPRTRMMPTALNQMCLGCHSDEGARATARGKGILVGGDGLANIATEFNKTSRHPLDAAGQTSSRPVSRRGISSSTSVPSALVCSDCHDAHYTVKAAAWTPGGNQVKPIGNARHGPSPEHDLCYRCHGTTANTGLDVQRLVRSANPSYHPVEAAGRNTDVPSLIQPYTAQSIVACTDCHGSNDANGPRGPHGSTFEPLLRANYRTDSGQTETTYAYALCYRCHNRTSILSETGSFRYHKKHIVDEKASCRACHNSHGSSQYSHLIDFDTTVVSPNSKRQLNFRDLGSRRGSCSLRCHDEDHDDEPYPGD